MPIPHSEPSWLVFLVDDDPGIMELYLLGLQVFCQKANRLKISVLESADEALDEANNLGDTVEAVLWIVDSMMPYFENENDGDADFTGLELVRRLKDLPGGSEHQYLMLTHLRGADVQNAANGLAIKVFEKAKYSPKAFAAEIDRIIK
jgi:CheY-like chemotaxis protein